MSRQLRAISAGAAIASLAALACSGVAHAQAFATHAPHFTAEQATRGRAAYASHNCGVCHGQDLSGSAQAPALHGPKFAAQWHGAAPGSLFEFIQAQMPPGAAGSLSAQTSADLAAYVFQANGLHPGTVAFAPTRAAFAIPSFLRTVNHDAIYRAVMAHRKAKVQRLAPVSAAMLRKPPAGDWLIWRRDYAGNGYSPLHQIDSANASKLKLVWSRELPLSGDEMTPLVYDGVIFLKSGNRVQALDGTDGTLLWQYQRPYPAWMHDGATEIVKSLAIYRNMLYVPFLDGHLVALDIHSGRVVWDHVLVGPKQAATRLPGRMDSPDAQHFLMVADGGPIVADGEVVIGLAGCSNEYRGGCFIVGLNAETGHQDWLFHTIARPGQPGGNSWNGAPVDERFGGSVWFPGSYDPKLNLVYFGTGQTYHLTTLLGPSPAGTNNHALYTDSTVALNARTGKLVWYYQHFPGDVWDLDWSFEQTLADLPVNGLPRRVLLTAGKIGIFDVLDRATGEYLFSKSLGLQNIVTAINPETGEKTINKRFLPPPGHTGGFFNSGVCPYARDEPSTAFDPSTHIEYIPVINDSCPDPHHTFDGRYGRLEALNLATRKVVWMHRQRAPEVSSVLVTAGRVVFDGTLDRRFRAFDARSGKLLWQTGLANAPKSSPVTYTAGGRQFVAVVTGDSENTMKPTPEIGSPPTANAVWVFALPASR